MTLAKYIRLSDQDGDCRPGEKPESNSVMNQRGLLDRFIRNDPELAGYRVLEFMDDGHTGTNFNRPGVQALFDAVKRGDVDCIVVKDLSRFGRNFLESGDYLERIFPFYNVRFIAVNDGFDSRRHRYGTAGDLDLGLRNLINQLYSEDISAKVKTARKQYAARGECVAAYPFYGYVKSLEDRRKLVIDPPAADTVREIFAMWLDGIPAAEIAGALNVKKAPTPSERKRQLGAKRQSWSKRREDIPWLPATIRVILRDERYTGKLVSLRTTRYEVGNGDARPVPREQWVVAPDAFEPIIDSETFQKAQARFRHSSARAASDPSARPLFYRKVHCGLCGMALTRQRTKRPYYKCVSQAEAGPQCKAIRIYEDELTEAVLSTIHLYARMAANPVESAPELQAGTLRARVSTLELQAEKERTRKKDAFVALHSGVMGQKEFESLCHCANQNIQRLQHEIDRLTQTEYSDHPAPPSAVVDALFKATNAKKLTRGMVDALVDMIHVFPDGRVTLQWKFADESLAAVGRAAIEGRDAES